MIEPGDGYLAKARESVTGARIEFEGGRYNNCASRSYYSCFHAAIHALISERVTPPDVRVRWGHDFVEAQFVGQLINRRHRYETTLRNVLRENRRLREAADYAMEGVSEVRASRALQRAERFVGAIGQGQEERS